jgi:hypothetical protein
MPTHIQLSLLTKLPISSVQPNYDGLKSLEKPIGNQTDPTPRHSLEFKKPHLVYTVVFICCLLKHCTGSVQIADWAALKILKIQHQPIGDDCPELRKL